MCGACIYDAVLFGDERTNEPTNKAILGADEQESSNYTKYEH